MHNDDELTYYNVFEDELVNELLNQMPASEVRFLHATLKRLGHNEWMAWLSMHLKEVSLHVQAGSHKHGAQMSADAEFSALLLYGAIQLAQLSGRMAHYFDNPDLTAGWANPHDRRAARGHLLWQANFEPLNGWPFHEPAELGNPFVSDE